MPRRTIVIDDGEEQNGETQQWQTTINATLERIEQRLTNLESDDSDEAENEVEELTEATQELAEATEQLTEVVEELTENEPESNPENQPENEPETLPEETTEIEITSEPLPMPEKPKPSILKTLFLG